MSLLESQIPLICMRKKTKSFQNNQTLCILTNSFYKTVSEEFESRVQEEGMEKEERKTIHLPNPPSNATELHTQNSVQSQKS